MAFFSDRESRVRVGRKAFWKLVKKSLELCVLCLIMYNVLGGVIGHDAGGGGSQVVLAAIRREGVYIRDVSPKSSWPFLVTSEDKTFLNRPQRVPCSSR